MCICAPATAQLADENCTNFVILTGNIHPTHKNKKNNNKQCNIYFNVTHNKILYIRLHTG